ncbi:hypothetical protein [Priestia megaterium]|uniref:hypothetical protein n=1 Tax=Priestia megaterium TaxID=1404 RepID=UPI0018A29598|nr:hypothetical protein [Priestia megaterium]
MDTLIAAALYLSFCMSILLISLAYWESIQMSNKEGKVNGLSFISLSTFSMTFCLFTSYFYTILY